MMNCGYDPRPDGGYDLPPIAPQMWQAYHYRRRAGRHGDRGGPRAAAADGRGQHLSSAIHEAVSKCTEMDLTAWTMRALPFYRQTCRHAHLSVSTVPTIAYTKDGRWILIMPVVKEKVPELLAFLSAHGWTSRSAPISSVWRLPRAGQPRRSRAGTSRAARSRRTCPCCATRRCSACSPSTRSRISVARGAGRGHPRRPAPPSGGERDDAHWRARRTFGEVTHPELGRSLTYITSKWVSNETSWAVGRRAPRVDEDGAEVRRLPASAARSLIPTPKAERRRTGRSRSPASASSTSAWFLATAGGTRYLAALGAEVIKVEWKTNP